MEFENKLQIQDTVLFARIGRLTIENELLREQLTVAQQATVKAVAEANALRCELCEVREELESAQRYTEHNRLLNSDLVQPMTPIYAHSELSGAFDGVVVDDAAPHGER